MDQYLQHLAWIDEGKAQMITTLEKWVNVHSGSDNSDGLDAMLKLLKQAFSSLNAPIEEIILPQQETLDKNGELKTFPLGKCLSITHNAWAPLQIFLGGHMDIAYPSDLPLTPCTHLDSDTLGGRGTADMKGGLLVMLNALKTLEMSPFAGRIGWRVFINSDEELGSPGSKDPLLKAAGGSHLGLIFEPSYPDGTLVSARGGSANYSAVFHGKSAHAGRDFHLGTNALTSAARFALAVESLTDLKEKITVNVGYLEGGGPVNIVPDRAQCRFNIRVKNSDDLKMIKNKIEEIARIENHRNGITLILRQDTERPPKIFDKKTKNIFEVLQKCSSKLGMNLDWKPSGGVCDGNSVAALGIPVIDTLGVVGGNIHTAEEYVRISSIIQRSKLAARFLMQIAAGEVTIK